MKSTASRGLTRLRQVIGAADAAPGAPLVARLIVTTNGGQTWSQVPDPGLPSSLLSVTCTTASTCWAAGATGQDFPLGQQQPVLDSTGDQGQTWLAAQLPASYGITAVGNVSCSAATSCFAIAQTTNGLAFLSYGN